MAKIKKTDRTECGRDMEHLEFTHAADENAKVKHICIHTPAISLLDIYRRKMKMKVQKVIHECT